MFSELFLQEQQKVIKEDQLQSQILKSKLQSVNNYIESLLQKKVRIDLEIKRQKKVLSKLKQKSSTELKISAKLEGTDLRPLSREEIDTLKEDLGPKKFDSLVDLDKEVDRAINLLNEIQVLEESGQISTT